MVLGEKWLGLLTSLSSSLISNTGNYVAINSGVPDSISIPIILIAFGNALALYLDVVFAKYAFGVHRIPVPYSELRFRNSWFWNNIFGIVGLKYFLVALMDGIIVYWIYKRLQKKFRDRTWMKQSDALVDSILAATVTTFTFLIYGNFLRFNWALEPIPSVWTHIYTCIIALVSIVALW